MKSFWNSGTRGGTPEPAHSVAPPVSLEPVAAATRTVRSFVGMFA